MIEHYNTRAPAEVFYDRHRHTMRYVPWNGWFELDVLDMDWKPVDDGVPLERMRHICNVIVDDVAALGDPLRARAVEHLLQFNSIQEALRLARRREPILASKPEMQELMGKRNLRL